MSNVGKDHDEWLAEQVAEQRAEIADRRRAQIAAEKRRRARNVAILLPIAMGGAVLAIDSSGAFFRPPEAFHPLLRLTAYGLFALSGFASVLTYLQTGFANQSEISDYLIRRLRSLTKPDDPKAELTEEAKQLKADLNLTRAELDRVRAELERLVDLARVVGEAERDALVEELRAQLQTTTAQKVLDDIKTQVAATTKREARDTELLVRFDESRTRLFHELQSLGRRGNTNLAFGGIMAVIGLSLLGWAVSEEVAANATDFWDMLPHFLPRLTLVVMIELFAYFFLSLYKASLQEIKYFQNELTNVESKQIALRTAIDFGDAAMVTSMVNSLAATERNHILTKDQTTVELERAKIDRESRGDFVKAFQDLMKKKSD